MEQLNEQEFKKWFPNLISIPQNVHVDKINERLLEYCLENNLSDENIVETQELCGYTVNENVIKSEQFNEETKKVIEKMKSKYEGMDDVYISVLSEGNKVTQNGTLYSYETLNNSLKDVEFKRRLKEKSIVFQGDHPDSSSLFALNPESVFKNVAVLLDVFWEKIDSDPNEYVLPDPKLNKSKSKKKKMVETNGKPPIRLFGVFQLMGQHKEHFTDIIDKSRQGISSRGYGIGEKIEDEAENFLYYEILALQLETWDFVVRQSVKSASFTKDGNLNENQKNSEEFGIFTSKDDNVTISENSEINKSEIFNLMEDKEMNQEEILVYLRSVEGKAVRDAIVAEAVEKAKVDSEKFEKIAALESKVDEQAVEISEKDETINKSTNELQAMATANEELMIRNEQLEALVAVQAKKDFVAKKEAFYAQYNEETAEKLRSKLDGIETVEAFETQADILTDLMPESSKKNYESPSVAEQLTENSEVELEEDQVIVEHIEIKTEDEEAIDPFEESKNLAMSLFSNKV